MHRIKQLMKLHKLMAPETGGEGGSGGGGGTGDDAAAQAAALAAAKAASDAAAAEAAAATAAAKGKTGPSDEEAKLLKEAMKHKTRAQDLEAQLKELDAKLKQFDGVDLVALAKDKADKAEAERQRAIAAGEFERLTKQMADQHTAEQKTAAEKIAAGETQNATLQKTIADLTVGNAFASSKFVGEDLTLTPSKARVIYGQHFEFKDGAVVAFDKPAGASDRTMLVSSTGTPLSFEDALKKIVDADPDKDQLIRSKMKPGSGSTTTTKGSKKVEGDQNSQLSAVNKIALGLKGLAKKT